VPKAPGKITADEIDRRSQNTLEVPLLRFLGALLVDRDDGCWSIASPATAPRR